MNYSALSNESMTFENPNCGKNYAEIHASAKIIDRNILKTMKENNEMELLNIKLGNLYQIVIGNQNLALNKIQNDSVTTVYKVSWICISQICLMWI